MKIIAGLAATLIVIVIMGVVSWACSAPPKPQPDDYPIDEVPSYIHVDTENWR